MLKSANLICRAIWNPEDLEELDDLGLILSVKKVKLSLGELILSDALKLTTSGDETCWEVPILLEIQNLDLIF